MRRWSLNYIAQVFNLVRKRYKELYNMGVQSNLRSIFLVLSVLLLSVMGIMWRRKVSKMQMINIRLITLQSTNHSKMLIKCNQIDGSIWILLSFRLHTITDCTLHKKSSIQQVGVDKKYKWFDLIGEFNYLLTAMIEKYSYRWACAHLIRTQLHNFFKAANVRNE